VFVSQIGTAEYLYISSIVLSFQRVKRGFMRSEQLGVGLISFLGRVEPKQTIEALLGQSALESGWLMRFVTDQVLIQISNRASVRVQIRNEVVIDKLFVAVVGKLLEGVVFLVMGSTILKALAVVH